MADAPQDLRQRAQDLGVVVDQEHAGRAARPGQGGIGLGADRLARDRESERERGAASGLAVDTDVATVSPDDRVHHRQAQPRSALALGREERLEDPAAHGFGHADAGVGHRQHHTAAGIAARRDRQRAAVGHRVEGVEEKVRHQLGQRRRAAVDGLDRPEIESQVERTVVARDLFLEPRPDHRDRVVHALVHVDAHRRAVRPQARELLDPPHGLGAVHRRRLDDVQRAADELGVVEALLHELGIAEDRLQEIVEVVRDPARELAEGRQLLRLV